jgi:branched-chain amino acid transport system substrate-binding protein
MMYCIVAVDADIVAPQHQKHREGGAMSSVHATFLGQMTGKGGGKACVAGLLLGLAIVVGVMFPFHSGAAEEEPVVIAAIAARSGDAASSGRVLFKAVRFALDEINEAGGLLGRRVEVLEFDNQSTALGSLAAARQVVEADKDVAAVIGASWSDHSSAMAPVLQEAGIPMITPISTNPKVTLHGDHIFRACYIDPYQATVMARFAHEDLDARTAVTLVNVSRGYSEDLARFFTDSFQEIGGQVLWRGGYILETADYAELLRKARELDPDVLYVPGDYRDSSFIIKQARDLGLRATILGADGFGPRLSDYIGEQADGCYYTTHWHRESPLPESWEFVRRWEKLHGEIRQTTIALTYDAVMLWAAAVKRAGSFDRAAVRDALAAMKDFTGVTGAISFDANGDPVKQVVINKLENGEARFVRNVLP